MRDALTRLLALNHLRGLQELFDLIFAQLRSLVVGLRDQRKKDANKNRKQERHAGSGIQVHVGFPLRKLSLTLRLSHASAQSICASCYRWPPSGPYLACSPLPFINQRAA